FAEPRDLVMPRTANVETTPTSATTINNSNRLKPLCSNARLRVHDLIFSFSSGCIVLASYCVTGGWASKGSGRKGNIRAKCVHSLTTRFLIMIRRADWQARHRK